MNREDAISRQAVIDFFYSVFSDDFIPFDRVRMFIDGIYHSIPSVTPHPNEAKWIPVSERLPEKNMECLVTVGDFNLVQTAMYSNLMKTIDHRIFY